MTDAQGNKSHDTVQDDAAGLGGTERLLPERVRGTDRMRLRAAGPRIAVAYAKSTKGGVAKVYVDGVYEGRVSFRSTTALPSFGHTRTFTGLGAGSHTVDLVMVRGMPPRSRRGVQKPPGRRPSRR